MNKNLLSLVLLFYIAAAAIAQAPHSYTSSEILLQLKKLNTVGSVLYIAAHPDDENTRLLAYLENEKCLRTGYLSLTRGDGGQNLIGSEQGIELGLIRTQELLAARRVDGAEQFFTRAYDFGYSKNVQETFTKWTHDSILADVVWIIRSFRPDIIITRFSTDGSGGHGHHTASALLAEEAYDAAGDKNRFPEQLAFVDTWQPKRLFHNSTARFFNPNADLSQLIKLDVGAYNPLLGKSCGELAAESRSMHKSQGFGSAKQRGESFEYFKPVRGDTTVKDLFKGIDFTWQHVKGGKAIEKNLNKAIKKFNAQKPELTIFYLKTFIDQLNQINNIDHTKITSETMKFYEANELITACAGLFVETLSNTYNYSLDDTLKMTFNAINRGNNRISLNGFIYSGYNGEGGLPDYDIILRKDSVYKFLHATLDSDPHKDSSLTMPYWLFYPIKDNSFQITENMLTENPYNSKGYLSDFAFQIDGYYNYSLYRKFQYKWSDPEKGELYRPLIITPPVMINLQQKSVVFAAEKSKEIFITLKAGRNNVKGQLNIQIPDGWKMTSKDNKPHEEFNSNTDKGLAFEIAVKGDELVMSFMLTPPAFDMESTMKVSATVNNVEYGRGIKEIKYDHIPVQTWFPVAEAKLVKMNLNRKLQTVGYIEGAGDEIVNSLEQVGYQVVKISDQQLQNGDLSIYPSIVVGVRAFNTNEKLQQFKQRVFDYVKNGGNLVVQYNTNSFAGPLKEQISPVPFKLSRERVTIEEAPVTFAIPDHALLNKPNKITGKDFDGWIQERGIYFASDLDSNFQCPLLMNDPNEKPNKGSLIIAKYGKGTYIYTGLAFFRELPAGVPGAYRLFVNLVEYGK
ncbi:MAG: PIG-L family deacetylase [Bacteroidia bacterium]|nr:PIG-L family deacetylase [Bacteroidia bacterium]